MKPVSSICCILALLILSGCWPERIVWSPDGQRALVFGNADMYLCDGDGRLTELKGRRNLPVATWFLDSRRIAITNGHELRKWEEIAACLTEDDRQRLIGLAERFRKDIFARYRGDLGRLPSVQERSSNDLNAIKIYLRDRQAQGLAEKLGDRWQEFLGAAVDGSVIEVLAVGKDGLKLQDTLAKTVGRIVSMRLSRGEQAIAYTVELDRKSNEHALKPANLFVTSAKAGTASRLVAQGVNWYMDWSGDDRSLIYAAAETLAGRMQLGPIARRQVLGADGRLLKEFGAVHESAGIIFDPLMRIRCLRDGRILFSSAELHFPVTPADMPQQASLFQLDPRGPATIARVLPRRAERAVPDHLHLFRISPDETKVSIPGKKGQVAVVTLATGAVQTIVAKPWEDVALVPVWRSSEELCLMVPPGSPYGSAKRPEIVLWSSAKKYRCISKQWPDSLLEALRKPGQ